MQGTTPYDFWVLTKLTTHNCNNDKLFTDIDYQHADGKKSAWVPDKSTGGYLEGLCENDMKVADWEAIGKKINVNVNGEVGIEF